MPLNRMDAHMSSCQSMGPVLSRWHDRILQGSWDRGHLQRPKLQACTQDVPSKSLAHCHPQTWPGGFRLEISWRP